MAYIQGIIGIVGGIVFLILGYTEWFSHILNRFNIPLGDSFTSIVLGYVFLIGGVLWISYGVMKSKRWFLGIFLRRVIVVADSWLDIIGLDKTSREKARLKVLFEEPSGEPKRHILFNLFEFIKKTYGTDNCTILWWDDLTPSTKIISIEDIEFLQDLWLRISGNYLLFLPVQFEVSITENDEEEFIGRTLKTYSHLILKSPDAYEILYLSLNK